LQFIFSVIDQFIHDCWGLYAVDFDEELEPYVYFVASLVSREIPFLVSPEAAATFETWDVKWEDTNPAYARLMKDRVAAIVDKRSVQG
jgi:hypothetical protein